MKWLILLVIKCVRLSVTEDRANRNDNNSRQFLDSDFVRTRFGVEWIVSKPHTNQWLKVHNLEQV